MIAPLRQHPGAALLAASVPLTMPWEALNALAILIGAICGGILLSRRRGQWSDPSLRYLAAVSACLLLPCLLSAFDAYRPDSSWLWVATSIRFPLFAAALILLAQRPGAGRAMQTAIAIPVLLWLVDALFQACFGFGLGGVADADRLSGIFGSDDLKLGPAMAVLAPLLLVPLLNRRAALIAALLGLLVVVLLAGARAGWIGILVGIGALACYRWGQRPRRLVLILAASAALMLTLASVGYQVSDRFAERVDRTAQAFRGDSGGLDHALAGRLPIFATAWNMSVSHPINGVGVRSFRYAYSDHAGKDDPWINPQTNTGAAHPHYLWLEVSAEQGLLGVLGLLIAHWLLIARWRQSAPEQRRAAIAPAAALLVLMFPLNTHPALYASFWSAVWWWLIGLFIAYSATATGARVVGAEVVKDENQ